MAVSSPLGPDVLLLRHMSGTERLSGLFEFTLDLLSANHTIALADVLGQSLTVRIDMPDGSQRYFNGYASRFGHVGGDADQSLYRATLRPWLWFLTRTADCRIFQKESVPDIIKQVFRDNGFTDFKDQLSGTYGPKEYCVQYRETAFNFVSRLMEHEGIYYYFTHEDGKHTLVLADSYSAHASAPGYASVPYFPPDAHGRRKRDHIFDWSVSQEIQSGKYALTDFDFVKPKTDLKAVLAHPLDHAHADAELFDYPGTYTVSQDGETYARVRLEEQHAQYETAHGQGDARGLAAGALFTLAGYPRDDQNREYLITAASYEATAAAYDSSADAESDTFLCSFSAIEGARQYRPPRVTPKPTVQGPQTAMVVGKAGEEIWTDQHGRVKVQFHWDRKGKTDENSSCWLRVAQIWAGKNWGGMFVPRIGQEVIVDFLEGDPDQPIVTGRVYNGESKPPYALPDQATVSTIKSNSSKGGGGSNELRFEDKKDSEEVYFHAQKDFNRVVEHDDTLKVENDQTIEIKNKRTETVKQGDETVTIEQGNRTVTVKTGNDVHEIKTGNRTVTIDTGNDELTVKTGNHTIKVNLGKVSITAMQAIELTVGSNSVKIDATGVTISGTMVKVTGQAQTQVSGAITQVSGSGMLQLSGGVTMIG